jgi:hypothetical protein
MCPPRTRAGARSAARKDELENALKRQVCSGALSLAAAQRDITSDWEGAYRIYVGELS